MYLCNFIFKRSTEQLQPWIKFSNSNQNMLVYLHCKIKGACMTLKTAFHLFCTVGSKVLKWLIFNKAACGCLASYKQKNKAHHKLHSKNISVKCLDFWDLKSPWRIYHSIALTSPNHVLLMVWEGTKFKL